MIITVNSSTALTAALKSVHDGDTIQLSAGEYSISKIQNLSFAHGVTITSADPTHEAVLDGVQLQNVSGLTLSNMEVKVDETQAVAVIVNGGGNINLSNLNIHGSSIGDGLGVRVLNASNVTLTSLNVHDVHGGVTISNSNGVSVLHSQIYNLEDDGIQTGGSSNVTLSGNYFTNFFPKTGDHSDAMQFFTTGTTSSAQNITVTNNTYVRGEGLANTQGVFMGNELSIPYQNVNVSGNVIVGAIYQGINVVDAQNLTLTHNVVEAYSDINSWIQVSNSTNATVSGNTSTSYLLNTGNTGLVQSANATIGAASVGDASILNNAAVKATAAPEAPIFTISAADAATANAAHVAATSAAASTSTASASVTSAPVAAPAATVAPLSSGPLELVGVALTKTTAAISAPAGSTTGVILDNNTHVWSTTEIGGGGNDTLNAGAGADTLTGGAGADHFVFSVTPGGAADITDFNTSQDVIDLRGMLSAAGYHGTNAISDHYISLISDGAGGTKVMFDADGTGPAAAKYVIHIEHVAPTALTTSDWLFH